MPFHEAVSFLFQLLISSCPETQGLMCSFLIIPEVTADVLICMKYLIILSNLVLPQMLFFNRAN